MWTILGAGSADIMFKQVWDAYQVISFWKLERKFRQAIVTLVVSGDDD